MKLIDKLCNLFPKSDKSEYPTDLLLSDSLADIISSTGCLDILEGSSLRIYDGPVPKSPSSELNNNNMAWEWNDIHNEALNDNGFIFTRKSALVLYGENGLVRTYSPTFFRLTACNEHNNCVVQGSVGYSHGKNFILSCEYLISGKEMTVDIFSLYVPKIGIRFQSNRIAPRKHG